MKHKLFFVSIACLTVAGALCLLATSCKASHENPRPLIATIYPIKYVVEQLTCGDFDVDVLVPEGASPETYSPTPAQIINIENACAVFSTGLIDFEQELVHKVNSLTTSNIIDLSKGVSLIEGSCTHHPHHHNHGVDPHIWTSPAQLKIMASNAISAIMEIYPDSVKYIAAYENFVSVLEKVSEQIDRQIKDSGTEAFIIYHPALTYYARDYGIEQISIEDEGKEPRAAHMAKIVELAEKKGITRILYQRQFPRSVVESLASDISADIVEINPLREDIISEILFITNVITAGNVDSHK